MKLMKVIRTIYRRIKYVYLFQKEYGINPRNYSLAYALSSGKVLSPHEDIAHLHATINWINKAIEHCKFNGVSSEYSLINGWGVAYPETSGYIIATLIEYSNFSNNDYIGMAEKIGLWESKIQSEDGGVYSSEISKNVRIFNTGQVLLGWCSLYKYKNNKIFLESAIKAGDFIVRNQENDGSWVKNTYCGARTYHARVAWALIKLYRLTNDRLYLLSAIRNIKWVISNQNSNGWFRNCGFDNNEPITHLISYTLCGLLNSYCENIDELKDLELLSVVIRSADNLLAAIKSNPLKGIDGMVPGSFSEDWSGNMDYSCLTGNAQLATFYYLLHRVTGNIEYKFIANKIIEATKSTQFINYNIIGITGAIGGCYPITDGYMAYSYPNWGAKYFCDALMSKLSTSSNFRMEA